MDVNLLWNDQAQHSFGTLETLLKRLVCHTPGLLIGRLKIVRTRTNRFHMNGFVNSSDLLHVYADFEPVTASSRHIILLRLVWTDPMSSSLKSGMERWETENGKRPSTNTETDFVLSPSTTTRK